MIHVQQPLVALLAAALLVGGLTIYPWIKSDRVRVTPSKAVALAMVAGMCAYHGTLMLLLALLWPLSFIWFPEYWGNYTGFIFAGNINKTSPPILVTIMGWFLLVVLPPLLWWIASR
jgi:hypothetical protein